MVSISYQDILDSQEATVNAKHSMCPGIDMCGRQTTLTLTLRHTSHRIGRSASPVDNDRRPESQQALYWHGGLQRV